MNVFLRAKHWQLFLLTFGIPLMLQIAMFSSFFLSPTRGATPITIINYFKIIPLVTVVFMVTLLGWFWSVATGLQKLIPVEVKMKVTKFKVFFFIQLAYIVLIMMYITGIMSGNSGHVRDSSPPMMLFTFIVPLHLFSMFCIFYSLYFVAKTIKTVQYQRPVTFEDFSGEFFLIWFFPIGIWMVQPRVNRMIKGL